MISSGIVIVSGTLEGLFNFDPGPGSTLLMSTGSKSVFVAIIKGTGLSDSPPVSESVYFRRVPRLSCREELMTHFG